MARDVWRSDILPDPFYMRGLDDYSDDVAAPAFEDGAPELAAIHDGEAALGGPALPNRCASLALASFPRARFDCAGSALYGYVAPLQVSYRGERLVEVRLGRELVMVVRPCVSHLAFVHAVASPSLAVTTCRRVSNRLGALPWCRASADRDASAGRVVSGSRFGVAAGVRRVGLAGNVPA